MKRIISSLAVAVLSFSFSLLGCIGGGAGDDDDDDDGDGERSAEQFADAAIDFFERCSIDEQLFGPFVAEAEPLFLAEQGSSSTPDRQDLIDSFNEQLDNPALDLDTASYDGCLALLPTVDCNALFNGELGDCNTIFRGNRASGEGCASDNECDPADELFCDGASFAEECGTCAAPPGEGDACPDFRCADGFGCSEETTTCVALPGEGQACVDFACADDLTCNDDDICEAQGDPPPLQAGDACVNDACNLFQTGLSCDQTTLQCVEAVVVQPGDACDATSEPARYCINSFRTNVCADPESDGTFECTPLPQVGEPCLASRCAADATCDFDTSQCVALPGLGEDCDFSCVEGFECNAAGVCEAFDDTQPEALVCPA